MSQWKTQRASRRGSERTQWCEHQQQQTQKQQNRNTTAGCEHQKQRKQKQQNRNNTQHMIIVYIHPLPFRSIAVCIDVRTAILHRCSHLTFIPPSCICVRTFHFSIAVRCLVFLCTAITRAVRCLPCGVCLASARANRLSRTCSRATYTS